MTASLLQDARHAVRQLRRAPGLATAVVATLAIAIGAGATLFSLLNAVVLRPLPVRDPERLVVLSLADRRGEATRLIYYSTYTELVRHQKVFESLFAYSSGGFFSLEARGTLVDGGIAAITPEFFDVLGLRPLLGRLIGPRTRRAVVNRRASSSSATRCGNGFSTEMRTPSVSGSWLGASH